MGVSAGIKDAAAAVAADDRPLLLLGAAGRGAATGARLTHVPDTLHVTCTSSRGRGAADSLFIVPLMPGVTFKCPMTAAEAGCAPLHQNKCAAAAVVAAAAAATTGDL